jgi:hypothetical protein
MRLVEKNPPRKFRVGLKEQIEICDCGEIHLDPDEQVSFVTSSGKRHDFAAKSWGFYVTPSVNGRLKKEGFKTALVRNSKGQYYVMVVEIERIGEFESYVQQEKNVVLEWLDERKK